MTEPFTLTADDVLALARRYRLGEGDIGAAYEIADRILNADPDALRAYLDGAEAWKNRLRREQEWGLAQEERAERYRAALDEARRTLADLWSWTKDELDRSTPLGQRVSAALAPGMHGLDAPPEGSRMLTTRRAKTVGGDTASLADTEGPSDE